jgi:Flp pilus assembly pilin Flp
MQDTQLIGGRMESIKRVARKLLRDDSGASAVEYALVVAGIAAVVVVVVAVIGQKVNNQLSKVANKL